MASRPLPHPYHPHPHSHSSLRGFQTPLIQRCKELRQGFPTPYQQLPGRHALASVWRAGSLESARLELGPPTLRHRILCWADVVVGRTLVRHVRQCRRLDECVIQSVPADIQMSLQRKSLSAWSSDTKRQMSRYTNVSASPKTDHKNVSV